MADNFSRYSSTRAKANYKDVFYQGSALIFIRLNDVFPFPDDITEISRSLEGQYLLEAFQFTLDFLENAGLIRRFNQQDRLDGIDKDLSRYNMMYALSPVAYKELQSKSQDLTLGSGNDIIVTLLKKTLREKEVDVRRQLIKKQIDNILNSCVR